MKPLMAFLTAMVLGISVGAVAWSRSADRLYTAHFEDVMGTSLEVRVLARSESASRGAQAAALAEIGRASKILSGYDPDSEFSRWMRTSNAPVRVSPELI